MMVFRHCEQREAIQSVKHKTHGLLRYARKDEYKKCARVINEGWSNRLCGTLVFRVEHFNNPINLLDELGHQMWREKYLNREVRNVLLPVNLFHVQ